MTKFQGDVIREMRERHVSHPRCLGKTWLSFCLKHRQRRYKFRGNGRAGLGGPTSFTALACEACRVVKMRRYDFIGITRDVFDVPRRISKRVLWDL